MATRALVIDLGYCLDMATARRAGAEVAVEGLWEGVPGGRDRFSVDEFLATRERVADEFRGRDPGNLTLTAIERMLEEAGVVDTDLALAVDAVYREVRDRAAVPARLVPGILGGIRNRMRLALITVGLIDWRMLGVEFDTVLMPRSIGLGRGEPVLISRAAERLGVGAAELLVISDPDSPLTRAATTLGVATGSWETVAAL